MQDMSLWEEFKKTVKPLPSPKKAPPIRKHFFTRLFHPKTPAVLDLHGLTLEEAFLAVKSFLSEHALLRSKKVRIITGKGLKGNGQIKKELPFWLSHKEIAPFILRAEKPTPKEGGDGALTLYLKREKK